MAEDFYFILKPCFIKRNAETLRRLKSLKVISLPNEKWRNIQGYEGYYMISTKGRVKSLFRKTLYKTGKIKTLGETLKLPTIDDKGYHYISLSKENKVKTFSVHRLLMLAFVPNPENKTDVNHKNGNPSDNRISNLEWATRSENILHSFRVLGRVFNDISRAKLSIANQKSIISINMQNEEIEFPSLVHCAEFYGVHWTTIHNVLYKKYSKAVKLKGIQLKFKKLL